MTNFTNLAPIILNYSYSEKGKQTHYVDNWHLIPSQGYFFHFVLYKPVGIKKPEQDQM